MEFENTPLLAESAGIEVYKNKLQRNYHTAPRNLTPLAATEAVIMPSSSASSSSASSSLGKQQQQQQPQQYQDDKLQHAQEQQQSLGKPPNSSVTATSTTTTTTTMANGYRKQPMSDAERSATKKSLMILAGIFVTSLAAMFYVYMIFPELNESEKEHMKIPRDIQDAKMLAKVLDRYKDMYYFEVMFGVIVAYVFLQTFAIPGSLFLSILLGFLYRFPIALFLICFCSSLGATLCYFLSNLVGTRLIRHFWPKKISEWSKHVEKHRDSLFNYMLFLRMTPILPNWFINLASPVIGVPMSTFAFGTFCGVAPPSVLAIQAGKTLQKMTSSSDAFSWTSMGVLTACACLSLLPSLLKNKLKRKVE